MRSLKVASSTEDRKINVDSLAKSFVELYGGKREDYLEAATKFFDLRRGATEENGCADRLEVMQT